MVTFPLCTAACGRPAPRHGIYANGPQNAIHSFILASSSVAIWRTKVQTKCVLRVTIFLEIILSYTKTKHEPFLIFVRVGEKVLSLLRGKLTDNLSETVCSRFEGRVATTTELDGKLIGTHFMARQAALTPRRSGNATVQTFGRLLCKWRENFSL